MLRVAYISTGQACEKPKRVTAQQKLHMAAIASMAARKAHDKEVAKKMFAEELKELEALEKQYGIS